jgi:hypothetical protein
LALGLELVHDGCISGTGQHPAEVDDLLDVDVLALRAGEHLGLAADADNVLATEPAASSSDTTACHSTLWLVGC